MLSFPILCLLLPTSNLISISFGNITSQVQRYRCQNQIDSRITLLLLSDHYTLSLDIVLSRFGGLVVLFECLVKSQDVVVQRACVKVLSLIALHRLDSERCEFLANCVWNILAVSTASPPRRSTATSARLATTAQLFRVTLPPTKVPPATPRPGRGGGSRQ